MSASPAPPLRVSFTGYYGMKNFGDDLFGALCLRAAADYWRSNARLVGPTLPGVSTGTMPSWYPVSVYASENPFGQASRLYGVLRGIAGSDVLVLGGGSLINSQLSPMASVIAGAQRTGWMSLAAVGVSVGPFDSDAAERAAARFLSHFGYIATRDRRSYEVVASMRLGARLCKGRDLAGLLIAGQAGRPTPRPFRAPTEPVRIGIALCNYGRPLRYRVPNVQELMIGLRNAVQRLSQVRRVEVLLFSLNDHPVRGDMALTREFHALLADAGISAAIHRYEGMDPLRTAHCIGECDAVVSGRLHGAIAAYMQRVPVAIVDYHPKCRDFAEDVSLPEAQRISVERCTEVALENALSRMLDGGSSAVLDPETFSREAALGFREAPWSVGR